MKINRNSWHYKLLDKVSPLHSIMPTNLCEYFWTLIFYTVLYSIFITVALGLGIMLVVALPYSIYCMFTTIPNKRDLSTIIFMSGFIAWFGIIATGLLTGVLKTLDFVQAQEIKNKEKVGFSGLLISRFKAYKDKTCPLIEYVDEDFEEKE